MRTTLEIVRPITMLVGATATALATNVLLSLTLAGLTTITVIGLYALTHKFITFIITMDEPEIPGRLQGLRQSSGQRCPWLLGRDNPRDHLFGYRVRQG
jgi:hypothetical protein